MSYNFQKRVLRQEKEGEHAVVRAPVLNLPTDRPRPAVPSFRVASHGFKLKYDNSHDMKVKGEGEGGAAMLLAAFGVLLYRYTGQEEFAVGCATLATEGAEGNLAVLWVHLQRQATGREVLRQVSQARKEVPSAVFEPYQTLPFQAMFMYGAQTLRSGNSWLYSGGAPRQLDLGPVINGLVARVDLSLRVDETDDGLVASLLYNPDLFEAAMVRRMAGHFERLLVGMVANPRLPISQLPLLTQAEREQLLVTWNDTERDYPNVRASHQLFEVQVAGTPDALAVVFGGQELTYQELNRRANQLAHYLIKQGVEPETLVGLCVPREPAMVVGVLAILKAGGAYVPFDPAYPKERQGFMLEDSGVQLLLTTKTLLNQFPDIAHVAEGVELIDLDEEWDVISRQCDDNPVTSVKPDNLAYVLYTSGSTGTPKGVTMPHRPLLNLIWWQLHNTAGASTARTLQFAPISFDVSFQDIFSTLCAGGTLVLLAEETRHDPQALLRFLTENKVERIFLPFVALQQLAEVAERDPLPVGLREVMTAGEQLQITPAIANWFKKLPNCTLHNQYGPTESHVVTAFTLTGDVDSWPALPPIGRPIGNGQTYILDQHLQPLPIGVPGELYLGGDCLARGYLNRPELTKERFIPNPFSSGRIYKTGDLARYLPDGNIQFLGRIDHQVKIRGFRVELGEIETVTAQHPTVRECVVMAREDLFGNKRLVAYIVPNSDQLAINYLPRKKVTEYHNNRHSPSEPITRQLDPQLHDYLRERLPEYMIPRTFVRLEALPLTPSGKINRRALPAPSTRRPELERPLVLPQTESEAKIAAVWQAALQLEVVGIHDNFFDLGGHSLLLTHVHRQLAQLFPKGRNQPELPIVMLFQKPTIHALAKYLDEKSGSLDQKRSQKSGTRAKARREERRQSRTRRRKRTR